MSIRRSGAALVACLAFASVSAVAAKPAEHAAPKLITTASSDSTKPDNTNTRHAGLNGQYGSS